MSYTVVKPLHQPIPVLCAGQSGMVRVISGLRFII